MKRFWLLIISVFVLLSINAQIYYGSNASKFIAGSSEVKIDQEDHAIVSVKFNETLQKQLAANADVSLKTLLKLKDGYEFVKIKEFSDKQSGFHKKYQLYYNGIRVENMVYTVHYKENVPVSANGAYKNEDISIPKASITKEEALKKALFDINADKYKYDYLNDVDKSSSELVLLLLNNTLLLTYKFDVYSIKPLSRYYVYVDAATGKIIKKILRIQTEDAIGTATTKYSGERSINTELYNNTYRLRETGRGIGISTFDLNNGIDNYSAVDFTDTDNIWDSTVNNDDAAYDAHFGAEVTFDYYKNTFNRNSYDDAGSELISYVHYDYNYVNAFWDGSCMTYGDGDGNEYTPLTSLDIVAHELTHGVTQYSANLVYADESGALNESFSDIFGIVVDFEYNPTTANYLMGDQISTSGSAFRSMEDPNLYGCPDTYHGDYWDPYQEVHTNSGVQNFWFYLLVNGSTGTNDNGDSYNVESIGMDKAAEIAYRNLTVYLTPESDYEDARYYSIMAATDLYGSCSQEVISVTNAWHAVGVGDIFSNAVVAVFSADQTYFCSSPAIVSFKNSSVNGDSYLWDFGDGDTSSSVNPLHTYNNPGLYNVRLIVTGWAECGSSDTLVQYSFIEVTNQGAPVGAACTPEVSNSVNYGFESFEFAEIVDENFGTESYYDKTCSKVSHVTEGKQYVFTLKTTSVYSSVAIWFDKDNNGAFDETTELIFSDAYDNSTYSNIYSGKIRIPGGLAYGEPLRLRVASDYYYYGSTLSSCNSSHGQFADYSLIINENTEKPVADFLITNSIINKGDDVYFIDNTENIADTYSWSFPGGTPSSSTLANPVVTYNDLGSYDVTLVVSNQYGSDSIFREATVNVVNTFNMGDITQTTETAGVLYDSGGQDGDYGNSENYSFLINIPCAKAIGLKINKLALESCCDRLSVYDGENESGTQLFSGYSAPNDTLKAYSGNMYIAFYSDGSSTDEGFEAVWSSELYESVKPEAAFEIADTFPALNTIVRFTDQSTPEIMYWQWDFNGEGTSSLQNPQFAFTTSGNKTVTLIASTCNNADTISKTLTVQQAPVVEINPMEFNVNLNGCGADTTLSLKIKNVGQGKLAGNIAINQGLSNMGFYDEFEDGSLEKWNYVGDQNMSVEITTEDPAVGNHCLKVDGGIDDISKIMTGDFPSDQYNAFSLYFKAGRSTGIGVFTIGQGDLKSYNYTRLFEINYYSNYISLYAADNMIIQKDVNIGQWNHIEIYNINYETKTFDVTIDGEQYSNFPFYSQIDSINQISIFNWSEGLTCFDDIIVSKDDDEKLTTSLNGSFWLSSVSSTIEVLPNDSIDVAFDINTTNINAGIYNSTINITSNDTINSNIIIPVVLNYTGSPVMELSLNTIAFNNIMQFTTDSSNFLITNSGCDTLKISGIEHRLGVYTVSQNSAFVVLPHTSQYIGVNFNPLTVGEFIDTIMISGNAGEQFIVLNGTSFGAPVIQVNPVELAINIDGCGSDTTVVLNITNTGLSSLTGTISVKGSMPVDAAFYEGFEDGNLNKWSYNTNSNWQIGITEEDAAVGNHCLKLDGGVTDYESYLKSDFEAGDYNSISYYFKPTYNADYNSSIISIGYNDSIYGYIAFMQAFCYRNYCNFYTDAMGYFYSNTIDMGQWYHIAFKNLNYQMKTFDFYINDSLVSSNIYFRNDINSLNHIQIYNYYEGLSYFDEIIIGNEDEKNKSDYWLTVDNYDVNIEAGSNLITNVNINTADLNAGTYNAKITIATNDPVNSMVTVPVSLELTGSPVAEVSQDAIVFGSDVQNKVSTQLITVSNTGCDSLYASVYFTNNIDFTVNVTELAIKPSGSQIITITNNRKTIGNNTANLNITYDEGDIIVPVSGEVYYAPSIAVVDTVIIKAVENGEIVSKSFSVGNTGKGVLDYEITYRQEGTDSVEVLLLTNNMQYSSYYIYNAISQYYSNYHVTELYSYDTLDIKEALNDKDVFISPANYIGDDLYYNLQNTLNEFASNGGTVLFVGGSYGVTASGLFSGDGQYSYSSEYVTVTENGKNDKLTTGIDSAFYTSDFYSYVFNDSNTVSLVNFNNPYDDMMFNVVTYKNIGTGRAIYVGFNYNWNYSSYPNLILSRAIQYSGKFLPSWISFSKTSGAVSAESIDDINITINPDSLEKGTYSYDFSVNSNDPLSTVNKVVLQVEIIEAPVAQFSYSFTNGCKGIVKFTNTSIQNPDLYHWDFGDSTVSDQFEPIHIYPSAGTYEVKLTVSNDAGTSTKTLKVVANPLIPEIVATGSMKIGEEIKFSQTAKGVNNWLWLFGDNSQYSTDSTPIHTYTNTGYYTVSLTVTNNIGCDATVSKFVEITLLSVKDNQNLDNVKMYPVPNNGVFSLEISALESSGGNIEIINAEGKIVYTEKISNTNTYAQQITLNNAVPGIYLLKIVTGNNFKTMKFEVK